MPVVLRFVGTLDVAVLEQSCQALVDRHELLRTHFPSVDGQPTQVIAPDVDLTLPVIDLQQLPLIPHLYLKTPQIKTGSTTYLKVMDYLFWQSSWVEDNIFTLSANEMDNDSKQWFMTKILACKSSQLKEKSEF